MAARATRKAKHDLRIKRVYADTSPADGRRILVDRLWPRGLTKEAAKVDVWVKALAPSDALRKRVHADPGFPDDAAAWSAFERAYRAELAAAAATPEGAEALAAIRAAMAEGTVTLVFGLKHETRNNAAVVKDFLLSL